MNLTPDQISTAQSLQHASEEDKVEFCRQLIIELKWTLDNRRHLGHIWKVGPGRLGKMGQLANSIMVAQIKDPEELRQKLIEQAHFVVSDAMDKKRAFVDGKGQVILAPDPDHKAALQGLNFIGKLSGLDKVKPPEPEANQYAGKTLAELLTAAQTRLLPEGEPMPTLEIDTEGQETDEAQITSNQTPLSDSD